MSGEQGYALHGRLALETAETFLDDVIGGVALAGVPGFCRLVVEG